MINIGSTGDLLCAFLIHVHPSSVRENQSNGAGWGDSKYPSNHTKVAFVSKETCRRDQSPKSNKAVRLSFKTCFKVSTCWSHSQVMSLNTSERISKLLHLDVIVQNTSPTLQERRARLLYVAIVKHLGFYSMRVELLCLNFLKAVPQEKDAT